MVKYLFSVIPVLILYYFTLYPGKIKINTVSQDIKCISVTGVLPVINPKGKIEFYDTNTYKIYYYKNMVMCEYPYGSFPIDPQFPRKDSVHSRIIYERGKLYGYYYNTSMPEQNRKILLDSALDQQGIHVNLSKILRKDIVRLVSSHHDTLLNILQEIYVGNNPKEDAPNTDSLFLFFSDKMQYADFTFFKTLDSIKNLKLYKIVAVIDKRYLKDKKIWTPKTGYSTEIKEISINNEEEIISYFERYKKDILNN